MRSMEGLRRLLNLLKRYDIILFSVTLLLIWLQNIVSAVGALSSALPLRQRLSPADLVLPADSFSHSYVLCLTFAALFNHASLAINSVAGPGVELPRVTRSVSPTIIIASAETLANTHTAETAGISSSIQKIAHVSQSQAQSAGRMPTDTLLFKLLAPSGNTPGKLRLIFTSERVGASSPALSSTMLSDLRIFTRSRICYALTAANVAGAVAQTNLFDYRGTDGTQHSHFGVPLSSVEVKLVSKNDAKVDGNLPEGEVSPILSAYMDIVEKLIDRRLSSPDPLLLVARPSWESVAASGKTAL